MDFFGNDSKLSLTVTRKSAVENNWRMMIEAKQVLSSSRLGKRPLFFVGTFDSGITVLSQQVRALNLAWAFVEDRLISCDAAASAPRKKIAVVGAGFAGLTFTAALIEKGANAEITLFEERDTLLPLQQGSDSRWLHPGIYDWPSEKSEPGAAIDGVPVACQPALMLPYSLSVLFNLALI